MSDNLFDALDPDWDVADDVDVRLARARSQQRQGTKALPKEGEQQPEQSSPAPDPDERSKQPTQPFDPSR